MLVHILCMQTPMKYFMKPPKLKVVSIMLYMLYSSVTKMNCPITNFGIVRESHISLRAFPHIAWSVQEVSCVSVRGDLGEDFSFSYKYKWKGVGRHISHTLCAVCGKALTLTFFSLSSIFLLQVIATIIETNTTK